MDREKLNNIYNSKDITKVGDYIKKNWMDYVVILALIFIGFVLGFGINRSNIQDACNDFIEEEILNIEVRECLEKHGYFLDDIKPEWADPNFNWSNTPAPSKNYNWSDIYARHD